MPLKPIRVSVIGDVMLDHYSYGSVERISPEAPVPIFKVEREEFLPGGAGNVALNLLALGAEVRLFGRVGDDAAGKALRAFFPTSDFLLTQPGYLTAVKQRLIASGQHVVRLDREDIRPLPSTFEKQLLADIFDADILAISDYGKGLLTKRLLKKLLERASSIPILVDPKGLDFSKYRGATLIKPNLKEALMAANVEKDLDLAAKKLLSETEAKMLLITRSGDGMSLFTAEGRKDFPVHVKEVVDVTGAGDTVLAVLTSALANNLSIEEGIVMANAAASLAIEHVGCARITLPEIAERMLGKRIDAKHWFLLEEIVREKQVATLGIDSRQGISVDLLTEIQSYKETKLLIYFTDERPDPRLIDLLSSFDEVDFILETPLEQLAPLT